MGEWHNPLFPVDREKSPPSVDETMPLAVPHPLGWRYGYKAVPIIGPTFDTEVGW